MLHPPLAPSQPQSCNPDSSAGSDSQVYASGIESIDAGPKDQEENRRRKWDCFHIATAMCLGCGTLYAEDSKLLKRKDQLAIDGIDFRLPRPRNPELLL
jgi:hypothetical protein